MSTTYDPRITAFHSSNEGMEKAKPVEGIDGFIVHPMPDFDPKVPASSQDQYHKYEQIASNAGRDHYNAFGDVTIFYSETAPTNYYNEPVRERYIIIVDQWTGKRMKVVLPFIAPTIEQRVDAVISEMKHDPRWWDQEDDQRRVARKKIELFPSYSDEELADRVFIAFGKNKMPTDDGDDAPGVFRERMSDLGIGED